MSRSFLFVPADSERKLAKAAESDADALIVDLEDAVEAGQRPAAREALPAFLSTRPAGSCWVRINPLDSEDAMLDLRAAMRGAPAGIVLPKARGADDLRQLDELLGKLEAEHGRPVGATLVMPIVTETPAALFRVQEYEGASRRLFGLTWGAEDLSAAIGASANRANDGSWLPPYELARSLCLFGAVAAGVAAIDTVHTNFRDEAGLERQAAAARRDGFSGMLAIHPAQLGVINAAFTPSQDEVERAERIVALFAANPAAGTLGLDGEMLDRPHLVRAQRILALAGRR